MIINIIICILVVAFIAGAIYLISGKEKLINSFKFTEGFKKNKGSDLKKVRVKLKALEETRSFYKWELKKEDLTEKKRNKFSMALNSIEKIIKKREARQGKE